ncbi:MAG: cyclic nucleotide-binding domain-containing protein [Mariprofundaceae bacterium]|nr:cyclic nucleotide-binding domain-containing protein [Mariprofundaceae bacterium]
MQILMRQARKAACKEQYQEACSLYQQIITADAMKDNLDIKLRLAWSHERLGNIKEACELYLQVIHQYTISGEEGAARALQKSIDALQTPIKENIKTPDIKALDDAEMMVVLQQMGSDIQLLPSDILYREGDIPDTVWMLKQGSLSIHMTSYNDCDDIEERHAQQGALVLIGELSLFTGQRRYATVRAESLCRLCGITIQRINAHKDLAFQAGMKRLLCQLWVDPTLAQHDIFERMNDVDRLYLSQSLEAIELEAGQCLMQAGEEHDGAYLVQTGCLFYLHDANYSHEDELEDGSLLTSVVSGDMVNLGGLLHGYQSECRIVAATPSRLLRLSKEMFELFALRRPWIIQAVLRYCRRPSHLQALQPAEDYLWKHNKHVELRRVTSIQA